MKKTITFLIFTFLTFIVFAQDKINEYRYLAFKYGIVHNISLPPENNPNLLIHSPYGDLLKRNNEAFAYTPGATFSIVYNIDFKNDKYGIVFGGEVQDYGFTNHYKSDTLDYKATEQYRSLQVGIPVYFKFGYENIYKMQFYGTLGIEYNYIISVQEIQTSNWNSMTYIANLPSENITKSTVAFSLGLNYSVYYIKIMYLTSNFLNSNYVMQLEEGKIQPYTHINKTNNLYITTGMNIPLTRWLTARNWTAEKIRRAFKRSK